MSTEPLEEEVVDGEIVYAVVPWTGEAISLRDASLEQLAESLNGTRQWERERLSSYKRLVQQEIISRLDHARKWTAHAGAYKLSCASPAPSEEWDGAELRTALLELVDAGELPIEAVDAAVQTVVTYKPMKSGIAALRKGGGRAAAVVDELCQTVQKDRYIKVERSS